MLHRVPFFILHTLPTRDALNDIDFPSLFFILIFLTDNLLRASRPRAHTLRLDHGR